MKKSGAQLVCEALLREGVEVVFGIPGGAILPLYQTLPQYPHLRHILTRHEEGAAMAADGYARVTGKVGVCWATSGPGATDLITGIANAMMDSVPVVAITGQVSRKAIGTDAFQETDIIGICLPITKHSYQVWRAADLPRVVKEAFVIASTGRPGPVLIDIPKDVFTEQAEAEFPETVEIPGHRPVLEGHPAQLRRAVRLIQEARRPLILAGHGVLISRAWDELRAFAEKTGIPVITTLLGISAFPADHVLYVGMPGMHGAAYASLAIDEADLLIALGMRFDDRVTGNLEAFARGAKVIHVDIDPAEIGKNRKADVPIVGDVRHVLRQLLPIVPHSSYPQWLARIEQLKREHPLRVPDSKGLLPQEIIEHLSDITGGRAIITTGVGQHQMWAAQFYKFVEPNLFLTSGGLGAMGYEVPSAIGAQIGRPDKMVWSIAGDGGFQMTMCELATVVENRLPIKFAIINNRSLGMVRQWQQVFYQRSYVASCYECNPDFVKLAEAYGIRALRVTDRKQVRTAIEEACEHPGPVLVDFLVEQEENVYPFIPPGMSVKELIEDPRLRSPQAERML
ncbi:MAG: biosynthetic-type acetolactate synthase large subunit [Dehalococcoidia bacterium]|nr:biosynthetic-type acetolactate synthase large subunit [Dehalococcoidia bacterium]MDW8119254.1 biosynthetic-type acetolactate synthase large subunit [Chloroflexota bacterium]